MSTIEQTQRGNNAPVNVPPPRVFPVMPRWATISVAIAVQVLASLVISEIGLFGLVHATGLLAVGMYAVLRRDLPLVLCCAAYLTGSEVMWRQASAPIPYLAAPYMLIVLSVFAVVFGIGYLGRNARWALLYVAMMLPAAINTIRTAGGGSRELIAFALSGPIALGAFVAFTSQVRIAPWLYRRVLWVTLISAIGPLTVAVSRLRGDYLASGGIEFTTQSNFVTSGGFGPVQVSSVLALGILAAVLLLLSEPNRAARIIAGIAGVALMVQTLLTFSRGGSFSIVLAMLALALFHASDRRVRRRIFLIGTVALALAYFLVFPWLETFTGGAFQERFSDQSTSRTELAANDVEIFARNPVLGVGPGMTKYQRLNYEVCELRSDKCKDEASSHTEFTRLLGEHGVPGIISLGVLVILAINAYRAGGPGREFAVAFLVWSVAQMFYANLRITAVPFAFGLAFLRLTESGLRESSDNDPSTSPTGTGEDRSPTERANGDGGNTRKSNSHSADRTADGENDGFPAVPGDPRADRPVGFGAGYGSSGRIERHIGFGGQRREPTQGVRGSDGASLLDGSMTSGAASSTNGTTRVLWTSHTNGNGNGNRPPPPAAAPTDGPE